MSRLSFDGLVLQSNLGAGEQLSIQEAAKRIFGDENNARKVTAIAVARTIHAAKNLITLGRAVPRPSKADMQYIQSTATDNGMQVEAVMNLAVRQSCERRREQLREQTHAEIDSFLRDKESDKESTNAH